MFETNKFHQACAWLTNVRDLRYLPRRRRVALLWSGVEHVESLVHLVRWMAVRFTPSGVTTPPPRFPPPRPLAYVRPQPQTETAEQIISGYLQEMAALEASDRDNVTQDNLLP